MKFNNPFDIKSEFKMATQDKIDNATQAKLIAEYKTMQKHELYRNGIYVMPTSESHVWNCVMFIRTGHYKSGKFKLKVHIPEQYPHSDLKLYFQTKIYHPMINFETGELDLRYFQKSQQNMIERLLLYAKNLFTDEQALKKINSLNPSAGEKFQNDPEFFVRQVRKSIELAQEANLNDIKFSSDEYQRHVYDIREVTSTLVKCTGTMPDKINVLIDNVFNMMPKNT